MDGQLLKVFALTGKHYTALPEPDWLEDVGLGIRLWEGEFEGVSGLWLRWCDRTNAVIPTGAEARDSEQERSQPLTQARDSERERSQRLAERLREMGIDPVQV